MAKEPINSYTSLIYLFLDSILNKVPISKYISYHIRDRWKDKCKFIDKITNYKTMETILYPISKNLNIDINFVLSVFFYNGDDTKSLCDLVNENCDAFYNIFSKNVVKAKDLSSITILIRFMFELAIKDENQIIYPLKHLASKIVQFALSNYLNTRLFEWSLMIILQYFDMLESYDKIIEKLISYITNYSSNDSSAILIVKIIHYYISHQFINYSHDDHLFEISDLLRMISISHPQKNEIECSLNYILNHINLESMTLVQYYMAKYKNVKSLFENINEKSKILEKLTFSQWIYTYCFENISLEDVNIYTIDKSYWIESSDYNVNDLIKDIYRECLNLNKEELEAKTKKDKNRDLYKSLHFCQKALLHLQIQIFMIVLFKCRNLDFLRFAYSLSSFIIHELHEEKNQKLFITLKELTMATL